MHMVRLCRSTFLIPETVAGYDFGKGPYYSNREISRRLVTLAYNTKNVLNENMVKVEGGEFTRPPGQFAQSAGSKGKRKRAERLYCG